MLARWFSFSIYVVCETGKLKAQRERERVRQEEGGASCGLVGFLARYLRGSISLVLCMVRWPGNHVPVISLPGVIHITPPLCSHTSQHLHYHIHRKFQKYSTLIFLTQLQQ